MEAAMRNSNIEVLKLLLQAGLKVNETNDIEETAFSLALKYNPYKEVIKFLIENGADLGVKSENNNIVEILQHNKKLIDTAFISEIDSIYEAYKASDPLKKFYNIVSFGTYEEVKESLNIVGKRIIAEERSSRENRKEALMYAAQYQTDTRVIQLLIDNGAYIRSKDENDWEASHYAAAYNTNPKVLNVLLKNGATFSFKTKELKTVLELASLRPDGTEMVDSILHCSKFSDYSYWFQVYEIIKTGYKENLNINSLKLIIDNAVSDSIHKQIMLICLKSF